MVVLVSVCFLHFNKKENEEFQLPRVWVVQDKAQGNSFRLIQYWRGDFFLLYKCMLFSIGIYSYFSSHREGWWYLLVVWYSWELIVIVLSYSLDYYWLVDSRLCLVVFLSQKKFSHKFLYFALRILVYFIVLVAWLILLLPWLVFVFTVHFGGGDVIYIFFS